MNGITFENLEMARTAFSLGPVKFRCNVCGGSHRSDKHGWKYCLEELKEDLQKIPKVEAFPEISQALSSRKPSFWRIPGNEEEYARFLEVIADMEAINRHFGIESLDADGLLKQENPLFGKELQVEVEVLALSADGYKRFKAELASRLNEYARKHREEHQETAATCLAQYEDLKRKFENARPDPSVLPVRCSVTWGRYGEIRSITFVYCDQDSANRIPEYRRIRTVAYNVDDLISDLLSNFPELPSPCVEFGSKGQEKKLRYHLYSFGFKEDGFYAVLCGVKTVKYNQFVYPKVWKTYHVLCIKDYENPVYLGRVSKASIAVNIDKAIAKAS